MHARSGGGGGALSKTLLLKVHDVFVRLLPPPPPPPPHTHFLLQNLIHCTLTFFFYIFLTVNQLAASGTP